MTPMKVLFAASEGAPFIKTGGLGDVAYALPDELSKLENMEICVFLPYYKWIKENPNFHVEFVTSFGMPLAWRNTHVGVFRARFTKTYRGRTKDQNVTYYFIDNDYYFGRDGCYGFLDDGERFAYFSKAILEAIPHVDFYPTVIHCNDWQTSLIPLFLKGLYSHIPAYQNIRTVFTIHNIEYQGKAANDFLQEVIGLSEDWRGVITFDGCVNCMKSAIVLADSITTVSKTYSFEIRHAYFAHKLEGILEQNAYKMTGIVNGIDNGVFNPGNDPNIPVNYKPGEYHKKQQNKVALQQMLGLPVDETIPMVALISRLVPHKGIDLIEYVSNQLANLPMQLVVLGTGDQKYEELFHYLAYTYPHKVSANILFDPSMASQLYAAADFLLMPSKSEPCGLSQLIAMRYGAVPIVRETGGLVDTVPPLNTETLEGRGFTFKGYNAHDMLGAVERAIGFYGDCQKWEQVVNNLMRLDTSWKQPAREYLEVYRYLAG